MRRLLPSLLLLPFFLGSCAVARFSTNEPIDVEAFNKLVPGKTTARQVVEALGAPAEVLYLRERTAYKYEATSEKGALFTIILFTFFNADERSDRVWVFFDENNIMTHKGGSFATHRTQYSAAWEDIHEESDAESRDKLRPGLGGKD